MLLRRILLVLTVLALIVVSTLIGWWAASGFPLAAP
jgi:hypothetical protein